MTPQDKAVQEIFVDGEGNKLHQGDRVYTHDIDCKMVYGTLHQNIYTHVSEWYVSYDDGQDCAVLDNTLIFKL